MNRRHLLAAAMAAIGPGALVPRAAAAPARLHPDPALWDPRVGPVREGAARGPNGSVYWRRYGSGAGQAGRTPVIVLHGGPAAGHRYMRPYAALAHDRPVVLYDQSGCGRSAAPADLSRYSLARYVAELEAVRAAVGFEQMALVGHSWGGLLAPAYAAAYPGRVRAMVLAGTVPRWTDFQVAAERWLRDLGPEAVATVRRAERSGKTDDPAYGALLQRYYALHVLRLQPWPPWFEAEGETLGRNPVYAHLNGPSEFQLTGAFSSLDMTDALKRTPVPVLVTCGEFDEAPPWIGRRLAALPRHGRFLPFDGLSHMSHIEDPARVVGATAAFLGEVA